MPEHKVTLKDDADVVAAWKGSLALGRHLGFSLFKQACLSGAVLELCRNVVERGEQGACVLSEASDERTLRARISVEGCSLDLLSQERGKSARDICVGPALPAVKLHQVAETLSHEAGARGLTVTLTLHQPRVSVKAQNGRRSAGLALERRR